MDITADQIQKSCTGTQLIEQNIKTILKTFQCEIIEAGKNGYTYVVVEVPTNFNIVGISNKNAQTIIYHRLITECENLGFNIKLSMSAACVSYCIRWDIKQDSSNLNEMRHIIASHINTPREKK